MFEFLGSERRLKVQKERVEEVKQGGVAEFKVILLVGVRSDRVGLHEGQHLLRIR